MAPFTITVLFVFWTILIPAPVHGTECGGKLTGMTGSITQALDGTTDCTWEFDVESGYSMRLTYHEPFDLTGTAHLLIMESNPFDPSAKLVFSAAFTSNTSGVPPVYTSTGVRNKMEIMLDGPGAIGKGINITWEKVDSEPECFQELSGLTGTFTSPNYPNNYDVLTYCKWVISVPIGNAIKLTFQSPFDVEKHDYVKVFETFPFDPNDELIERESFVGKTVPPAFTSISNKTEIRFLSDMHDVGKGFSATWEAVAPEYNKCGGTLTGLRGSFASPHYPSNYDDNSACTWDFDVPNGHFINIAFHTFSLEGNSDKFTIYENRPDGTHFKEQSYTGDTKPPVYASNTNRVEVTFTSDASGNGQGFYATWEIVDTKCTFWYTDARTSSITSLQYPNNYWQDSNCQWFVHAPTGKFIQLTFHSPFELDLSDKLEIFDFNKERAIVSYSGTTVPPVYTSWTDKLLIKFTTAESTETGQGFNITSEELDTRCGGLLDSPSGLITSPNYPEHYDNDVDCTWTITVPDGHFIQLTFQPPFHLQSDHDHLKITEVSPSGVRQEIGSYTGDTVPVINASLKNKVEITFTSDGSNASTGFKMTWDTVGDPCGGTLTGESGYITSPNYPQKYLAYSTCTWVIEVPLGNVTKISFSPPFDVYYDALKVRDISLSGAIKKSTRFGFSKNYTSSTNRVEVVFSSADRALYTGFNMTWERTEPIDTSDKSDMDDDDDDDDDSSRYLYALIAIPCVVLVIGGVYLCYRRSKQGSSN